MVVEDVVMDGCDLEIEGEREWKGKRGRKGKKK